MNTAGSDAARVPQRGVVPVDGDERGEVESDGVAHDVETAAERGVEHVEAVVEPGRHPDVLRTAPREHERDTRRVVGRLLDRGAAAVLAAQLDDRIGDVGGGDDATMAHRPSPGDERGSDVGQVGFGVRLQVRRQPLGGVGHRLRIATGDHEHLFGDGRLGGRELRRLLDDDVGVGATDTERADPGPPRPGGLPRRGFAGQHERCALDVEQCTRCTVVRHRRERAVAHRLHDLDQARRTGGGVEVADVGFRRHQPAEPRIGRRGTERFGERSHLDRVADRSAGAVRLEQGDRAGVDAGDGERLFHHVGVTVDARCQVPHLAGAVVVDRRTLDHGEDRIAVVDRILEATQGHDPGSAGEHRSRRVDVECVTDAVRREHLALAVLVPAGVRHLDRHAARNGQVALEAEQALHRQVNGDERRGARRLDVDRRAAQVELVRRCGREEVLVVAGVTEEEPADLLDQLGVGEQVVEHVHVGAATGEHADCAGEALGDVAGRFDGLPHALEEVPMLRVHDRRVAAADSEEPWIEHVDIGEHAAARHVVGRADDVRRYAVGDQQLGVEIDEAVLAGDDAFPQDVWIGCAWKAAAHPDDRDVGLRILHVTHCGSPSLIAPSSSLIPVRRPQSL